MHKRLTTYRKKRDFEKTSEPSGDVKVAPSKGRRFVIQKHDATRLHYDLRLEFDGVFKSWAVTRGPSLDPHDKRLAVEVEDHPLDYGDFEGTIPEDQYGGGTVQLWDRGYWDSPDPERGFQKGDLKFNLHGDKLHGSWVLVRMKGDRYGGKRTNWLLIKHRDEYARQGEENDILAEDRSVASGRSMAEIKAGKGKAPKPFMLAKGSTARADATWDSNRGTAAEARDRTKAPEPAKAKKVSSMPDFVPPQLCASVERPPSGAAWCHEIKFDGYRVQLRVGGRRRRALHPQGAGLGGEISGDREGGAQPARRADRRRDRRRRPQGPAGFLRAAGRDRLRQDEQPHLLRLRPAVRRRRGFARAAAARAQGAAQGFAGSAQGRPKLIRYVEHFEDDGETVLQSAKQLSLEGIISKKLDARYRSGRSESWTKAKVPRRA